MKKIISIFLIILLSLSVCSCGGNNNTENEKTPLQKAVSRIESAVEYRAYNYGASMPNARSTIQDVGNGNYEVTGYVAFIDSFGNNCYIEYTGKVTVNEEDNTYTYSYSIEDPS